MTPSLATPLSSGLVCTPEEFLAADTDERRRLVIKQINETPHLFDMGEWAHRTPCGTTFCLAGWAAHLAGYVPRFDRPAHLAGIGDPDSAWRFEGLDGIHRDPQSLGANLLGLSDAEVEYVFYDPYTIEEVTEFLLGE